MNVSYYPIKKNEIIQIIQMMKQFKKNELSDINHFFEKYNVNQTNKGDVYSSFNECLVSMDDSSFDESYGLCIAKIQKIFRGNFNFKDKSITKLFQTIPDLAKYRSNWETFIQTQNNKFRFNNELLDENKEASGVYISYNNLKSLYSEYQNNTNIKTLVNQYYGVMSDKFIQAINYCLENECGLLEANFTVKNIVQTNLNQNANINTTTTQVNRKDRPIVRTSTKIWTIIGYKILFELMIIVINIIVYLLIPNIESITTKHIPSVIITAIIVFVEWFCCIRLSFKYTTVEKSQLSTILRSFTIIFLVAMAINSYFCYESISKEVNKEVDYAIGTDKELLKLEIDARKSGYVTGTTEKLDAVNAAKEKIKNEVIKELTKKMIPYYVAIYAINIVGLFYARKMIKKMI